MDGGEDAGLRCVSLTGSPLSVWQRVRDLTSTVLTRGLVVSYKTRKTCESLPGGQRAARWSIQTAAVKCGMVTSVASLGFGPLLVRLAAAPTAQSCALSWGRHVWRVD